MSEEEQYNKNPKQCPWCKGFISYNKMNNQYCSRSCSSYAKVMTQQTKQKYKETAVNKVLKNIEEYEKNPKYCKQCNKKIDYKHKGNQFCCHSCRNKVRKQTNETKSKISNSLKTSVKRYQRDLKRFRKTEIKGKIKIGNEILKVKKYCFVCKKEMNIRNKKFCSNKCSAYFVHKDPEYKEKIKQLALQRVKNGTHQGWKSRSKFKPSYPQKYFIEVLNNDNVQYKRDKYVGGYFIDFAIEDKMIALQVDGKQHQYEDRKRSDIKKDKKLIQNGWKVFRIKWYNPVNEVNKEKLYSQINEFKLLLK